MTGYLHSIETMGAVDGPGIRTVVFMQGCFARCIYCHNPDTWKLNGGKVYEANEIVKIAKRYKPYYGKDGGVTFSGGEPLLQGEFITECMKALKKEGINSIIDTSGTYFDEHTAYAIEQAQMIILDIKHWDAKLFKEITSISQKNLLKIIEIINKKEKPVWIRQVIVPGINDTENNIKRLNEFIKNIKNIENIELLGYHNLGEAKWEKLNLKYRLKGTPQMDPKKLEKLNNLLNFPTREMLMHLEK
ncbi:pyruvate formate-lyase-activating protein [Anaerovorax odorimutans]|uniref:pyruvate formate-lyase-activating protein n=1 Tax=Anaerovorax odorimutans TaxID=109327 RepID=UPI0004143404|nr:pyruvate formate-lyase-activating protein [Anaerovorax odorimutans]